GLSVCRQGGEALNRGGDRLVAVREIPALDARLLPDVRGDALTVTEARRVRQQVPDGNGPPCSDDVVTAAVARLRDSCVLKLRQVAADRIRDQQLAFLLQHHHSSADDGLGLR